MNKLFLAVMIGLSARGWAADASQSEPFRFAAENCPVVQRSFWMYLNPFQWSSQASLDAGTVCTSASRLIQYQVHRSSDTQIRALLIQRGSPNIHIEPVLHPKGRGPLRDFYAASSDASIVPEAVVNGGFFDMKTGTPIGFLVKNNHLKFLNVASSKYRSMVGLYTSTGTTGVQIRITDMQTKPRCWISAGPEDWMVSSVNVAPPKEGFGLFTPAYGDRTPYMPRAQTEWLVRSDPSGAYQIFRTMPNSWGGTTIPTDGLVLSASTSTVVAPALATGEDIQFKCDFPDDWERDRVLNGFMAGPRLIRNGEIDLEAPKNEQVAHLKSGNRMMLGVTEDGLLVLAWLRRESKGDLGFQRIAEVMRDKGVVEAIGLDGGSSSSIYLKLGKGFFGGEIDHRGRRIPYGLLIGYRQPLLPEPTAGGLKKLAEPSPKDEQTPLGTPPPPTDLPSE